MLTEQAIAVIVFLALLAICVIGLVISTRESERLDRDRRGRIAPTDPMPVTGPRI
ncbi:MAG: hypothetical protein U1E58_03345 [Tabrizicola sp.]